MVSRTSECAPHPWVKATTRPSSLASPLAQTPKVSESGPAIRTRKPHVVHGSGADCEIGASGPASPSYQRCGGVLASLDRERAHPAQAEVLDHLAQLRLVVGVERVVAGEVRRHQPRVVVGHGQQVAR